MLRWNRANLVFVVGILTVIQVVDSRRSFTVLLERLETTFNPDYFLNITMLINRTGNSINGELILQKDIAETIWAQVELFKASAYSSLPYVPFFINVTMNVCKVLKQSVATTSMKGLIHHFMSHTDIQPHCPIAKGIYHLRDIGDFAEYFPPAVPRSNYRLDIYVYQKRQKIQTFVFKTIVHSRFVNKKN